MDCIVCDGKTKVTNSTRYEGKVYRKRKCLVCGAIFDTSENYCGAYEASLAFRERNNASWNKKKKEQENE